MLLIALIFGLLAESEAATPTSNSSSPAPADASDGSLAASEHEQGVCAEIPWKTDPADSVFSVIGSGQAEICWTDSYNTQSAGQKR